MSERSRNSQLNYLLDSIIVLLLVYLFATLPFAVVDFQLVFSTFNRLVLFAVAALCALSALSKSSFILRINGAMILALIVVLHTVFSILRAGTLEYARELVNLLSLLCIVAWARNVRLDGLVTGVVAVTFFYCADVLYQYWFGIDLFGFVPRNNRYWGAFYFGAPTFGTFLSFALLVPFFLLRTLRWKIVVGSVFVAAMIVANDRAPIVQTAAAILVFAPIRPLARLVAIACVLAPALFVGPMDPAVSNRVLALYWGLHLLIFQPGSEELRNFLVAYGFGGYVEIWLSVLQGWFRWDNLPNIIFGTGWGSVLDSLRGVTGGFSRPHSVHIDLLVSWGIVGYAIFLIWLVRLYRHHRYTFVMFAPCVLPVSSFSLTSANYLFMITLSYIFFMEASDRRREVMVRKAAQSTARRAMQLPDAVRA